MRITTSRAAKLAAAMAAAGMLTVACGEDAPSVGEATEGARDAVETGITEAESAIEGDGEEGSDEAGESTQVNSADGQPVTIEGDTLAKYNEAGGPDGRLGAPVAEAQQGTNGGSCQEFTGGLICDGESTDAQIIWGEIRTAWEGQGGQAGALGYPTGDEEESEGKFTQEFENGSISWSGGDAEITQN